VFLLLNYDVIYPNVNILWNVNNKILPFIAKVFLKTSFLPLHISVVKHTKNLEVKKHKSLIILEFEIQCRNSKHLKFCVVTVCCHGVLSQCIVTVCCHSVLSQCVVTVCCHGVLSRCVVTVCCHGVLSQCVVTVCCHSVLSQCVLKVEEYRPTRYSWKS
jgi:hypothetical protein